MKIDIDPVYGCTNRHPRYPVENASGEVVGCIAYEPGFKCRYHADGDRLRALIPDGNRKAWRTLDEARSYLSSLAQ